MRIHLDATCPRCGITSSYTGLREEDAVDAAMLHVCPDGVRAPINHLTERIVAGPGERTKLPEEK